MDSIIYGLGTLVRNIASFIMLPIYTRYLNPEDYGAVEMLTLSVSLFSLLIGLRITQSMFRFYLLEENIELKKRVVSTVLVAVSILSVSMAALVFVYAQEIVVLIFKNNIYIYEFKLFVFTLVTSAISQVGMSYIQMIRKPKLYVALSIFTLLLQIGFNLYYVVYLELHVAGVVYGSLSSGLIIMIVMFIYLTKSNGCRFKKDLFVRIFKYTVPMITASSVGFYVGFIDKYLLNLYEGLFAVGILAVSSRFASVVQTVYGVFNQSWMAARFDVYKDVGKHYIFRDVFRYLVIFVGILGITVALFSADVIYWMATESYYQSAKVVPYLVLAVIFNSFLSFFNLGILIHEKTGHLFYAVLLKAVIATVFYIALIPSYGVFGLAFGLVVANFAETFYVYIASRRHFDMGLSFNKAIIVLMVYVLVVIFNGVFNISGWPSFLLHIFSLVIFVCLLFIFGVINRADLGGIHKLLRGGRSSPSD